jgi:hypothetical protein
MNRTLTKLAAAGALSLCAAVPALAGSVTQPGETVGLKHKPAGTGLCRQQLEFDRERHRGIHLDSVTDRSQLSPCPVPVSLTFPRQWM